MKIESGQRRCIIVSFAIIGKWIRLINYAVGWLPRRRRKPEHISSTYACFAAVISDNKRAVIGPEASGTINDQIRILRTAHGVRLNVGAAKARFEGSMAEI